LSLGLGAINALRSATGKKRLELVMGVPVGAGWLSALVFALTPFIEVHSVWL